MSKKQTINKQIEVIKKRNKKREAYLRSVIKGIADENDELRLKLERQSRFIHTDSERDLIIAIRYFIKCEVDKMNFKRNEITDFSQ